MTEKKAERPKIYIEDVQKPISLEDFEKLRDGLFFSKGHPQASKMQSGII
jgi:hypothetical protein